MEFAPRDTTVPLVGCGCSLCESAREEQAKADPWPSRAQELYNSLVGVIFEPEPQAEPVYAAVLVPNYESGDPMIDAAELITAEGLIEALEHEVNNGYGFRLYRLGPCILDVPPK